MFHWLTRAASNSELISSLKEFGIIKSREVERAMRETDRGLYSREKSVAYNDHPHPIGFGATISAPHMHAESLELLKDHLKPGAKVLDVGSGSGYLTACLARMVGKEGKVIGIDVIEPLVKWSKDNVRNDDPQLLDTGCIELKVGDGWKGDSSNAPYDVIHVGAAAATIPSSLLEQLKRGGRMIIPVGTYDQNLMQVDKRQDGTVSEKMITAVRFVPLVRQPQDGSELRRS